MARAQCLCGAVAWELDGPFESMVHCHCSRCRKAHGSAFATYLAGRAENFRLAGAIDRAGWKSAPGVMRCFCRHCGSVVPGDPVDGQVFVPAGNFTADPGIRPLAHIFTASKAPWYEIRDRLPRFDGYPPGIAAPAFPERRSPDPPGTPRGSCLCGAAAYRLTAAPQRCVNCHCSRCRRARSAAHGSYLFAAVTYTRGAEVLQLFTLPEAPRFSYAFCSACGSSLPRPAAGPVGIPMGTLDDDPGLRPQLHIFVGSKAPWFEITDDLPQYREFPPGAGG